MFWEEIMPYECDLQRISAHRGRCRREQPKAALLPCALSAVGLQHKATRVGLMCLSTLWAQAALLCRVWDRAAERTQPTPALSN